MRASDDRRSDCSEIDVHGPRGALRAGGICRSFEPISPCAFLRQGEGEILNPVFVGVSEAISSFSCEDEIRCWPMNCKLSFPMDAVEELVVR